MGKTAVISSIVILLSIFIDIRVYLVVTQNTCNFSLNIYIYSFLPYFMVLCHQTKKLHVNTNTWLNKTITYQIHQHLSIVYLNSRDYSNDALSLSAVVFQP